MEIVNRVAESDIEVFNLEALWDGREVVVFDLAPFLVEGLVLRERPFREAMKTHDWAQYEGRHVAVHCSTDAIVPTWAYMLAASRLDGRAASVAFGTEADLRRDYYVRALDGVDWSRYAGKPVVIHGGRPRLSEWRPALGELVDTARPESPAPLGRSPLEALVLEALKPALHTAGWTLVEREGI